MKYILLNTQNAYKLLNESISVNRGYPFRMTSHYAPETPEEVLLDTETITTFVTEEGELVEEVNTTPTVFYKFPLSDDIMQIVIALAGKTIYNEDGSKLFANV